MRRLPIQPPDLVSGHSIQPIDPGTDFERQAARIDRLTADRELVDRLMLQGYTGHDWEIFRRALAEYGVAVMRAWIASGRIFTECRRKGFGAIARRTCADDDALGLAGETVTIALRFFRESVLIPGRWDMTKGASLNTFFIGACIRHFPNVYARSDGSEIVKHLSKRADEEPLAAIADSLPFSRPDRRLELADAVDAIRDPVVREALLDDAQGYTQAETAKRLEITLWTVEGCLRRYRRRVD